MQIAVGIICVLLGLMHFMDRNRAQSERRSYFLGAPNSPNGRGALALLEIGIGFLLLFTT